ncbi:RidA family protein [Biomaibacter acetigenes]|uniref:RidA family protein n=1 Tax=Biomaibacter acetigenes TaxID=2316383 RepID=A0A3G2R1Q1_9FIRM|nr:RidA family protein [Biomaibacter acetigenes]AYO29211.1 RidA family protein [Biomaibacter acetigenes]
MNAERILKEKYGLELPEPPKPAGLYIPVYQVGQLVYVSGQTPTINGKLLFEGKLGRDLTVEQGQQAARYAVINCLALLKQHLGDLDRVKHFVQLLGFVRSDENFKDQPAVINGASAVLLDIFGEKGAHTRLALGTNELPGGAPVEVTFIAEV